MFRHAKPKTDTSSKRLLHVSKAPQFTKMLIDKSATVETDWFKKVLPTVLAA